MKAGAQGRDRTTDTRIFSPLPYHRQMSFAKALSLKAVEIIF
jgi:hypothetical protein